MSRCLCDGDQGPPRPSRGQTLFHALCPAAAVPWACRAPVCPWALAPAASSARGVLLSTSLPCLESSSHASGLSPTISSPGTFLPRWLTRSSVPAGSQSTGLPSPVALVTDGHVCRYSRDRRIVHLPLAPIAGSEGPYLSSSLPYPTCFT